MWRAACVIRDDTSKGMSIIWPSSGGFIVVLIVQLSRLDPTTTDASPSPQAARAARIYNTDL